MNICKVLFVLQETKMSYSHGLIQKGPCRMKNMILVATLAIIVIFVLLISFAIGRVVEIESNLRNKTRGWTK